MVVRSTFSSWVRPVMPWFWITSFAINYGSRIMVTTRFKSNGNLESDMILAALFDERTELGEQRRGIMRAGRGFRMILHGEHRLGLVPHAFDGLVVQVDAVHDNVGRQTGHVHRIAVILRGDLHLAGFQTFHRLVAAAMAELELESFTAERLAKNLVTEADPENGNAGVQQRLHFADDVVERGR